MKIRKLEIQGFKSFVDRTVLHFDHEVTGIVGPNGCGKSNVVDAIKWAMGEQSPQRLRGKAMEDVIFAGSETRGPHGFAEVSITFENSDGLAPPEYKDYAEITVTRRLDRQGRSDYFINKTPVRLMDVTNLFLGTGVGRRAYSIIEQGRIGFIVSSKPEDRRYMIEEAAGITKFKARKKAAERKMDQTRQNLLRVGDILGELERSISSLKRQAQKAERYKAYRAEMRDLELYVASHRWLALTATNKVVAHELTTSRAQAEGARLGLRMREAELEIDRGQLETLASQVERAQNRALELDNAARLLDGQIINQLEKLEGLKERERIAAQDVADLGGQREGLVAERDGLALALEELEQAASEAQEVLARENEELERRRQLAAETEQAVASGRARVSEAATRIARAEAVLASFERRRTEARTRLEKLVAERDTLKERVAELEQESVVLRARLDGLRGGKEQTAARKAELETELTRLRDEVRASDQVVERLRGQLTERRSRLRSLEEVHQRFEGVGAGVRALMTKYAGSTEDRASRGVLGLVADRIECPAELTQALAGALGEKLQQIVVDDVDHGVAALSFLREGERGRATFLPKSPRRVAGLRPHLPEDPAIRGLLVDLVRGAREDEPWLRHLLSGIVVVETLEDALRIRRIASSDAAFVTLAGEVVRADGGLTGGTGEGAGAHMLELKREMRELHEIVAKLDAELSEAVRRHGELRTGIAERQAELDSARSEAHEAEIAIVKSDKDLRRADEERERTVTRVQRLEADVEEIRAALEAAGDEEAEARDEIEAARVARDEASMALATAEELSRERRASVDEQAVRATEVRVRSAQARQRAESDRAAYDRLVRSIDEIDHRTRRLVADLLEGAREQGRIAGEIVRERERLGDVRVEAITAHEELGAARAHYDDARHAMGEHEVRLKELRAAIDALTERATEWTLREREIGMEMEHLLEQIEERHRTDLRRVLGDYHLRNVPDEAITDRVGELARLIERMGEINLTAIEEFEEKSQRYEYLKAQQTDLEEALLQLDRAIRQMNRESKTMFREAFDAVNERFKRIFPQMFRGGKAELRLTEPDDVLESGVDIVAQPPGKKLGSLELMSGGEKALTAVALIFALFQYKPSPFCLLDEVDAPLDEANISRFAESIRQMTDRSQFIVVTHSKRTMEYTDVLYGVTMEQPGVSKLVAVELRSENRAQAVA